VLAALRCPLRGTSDRELQGLSEILYVSYDGLLEPLGESQVVSYLESLSPSHQLTVVSFEKAQDLRDRRRVSQMETRLLAAGISWTPLTYHRWPPVLSTAYDILRGIWSGARWAHTRSEWLVHARGYVAAAIALVLSRRRGGAFLFDMRGFWVDEKVDAGHWPRNGALYVVGKWFERRFFQSADGIVSLTDAGVRCFPSLGYELGPHVAIEVIPTCVDLQRFQSAPKDPDLLLRFDLRGHLVAGCVGTLSNWYLRRETLEYLAFLSGQLEHLKVLLVTRDDHQRLRADAEHCGVPADRLVLARADFREMPGMISLIDVGVFFIKACFSKKASAATKLGEFLACGVPVVINDGIGDSGSIVRDQTAGVVLAEPTAEAFTASIGPLRLLLRDPETPSRCRGAAKQHFDLNHGVAAYDRLYRTLLAGRHDRP